MSFAQSIMHLDFNDLAGMTGELTEADIKNGVAGDCSMCPVALAVAGMFEGYDTHVNWEQAIIHKNGEVYTYLCIGESLADWIEAFDNEYLVKSRPATLEIYTWNRKGYNYMLDIQHTEDIAA